MKIIFIANQAQSLYNAWSMLMLAMQEQGHEIVCIVPTGSDGYYLQKWQNSNIRFVIYPLQRKGINPIQDMRTMFCLYKIIQREKPHKIFTYAIKPNIYGNLVAYFAKNKEVYSCISGLGYCFEQAYSWKKSIIQKIAISLYKIALHKAKGVIFQNNSDKLVFANGNLLAPQTKIMVCNGTGVDLESFAYTANYPDVPTFLLVARLLKAKGIIDYAKAAKLLKPEFPNAKFLLLGPEEQGPGSLEIKQVMAWHDAHEIEYLGACKDVRPYIGAASVLVLPSWREGLACALMEGMSMGRAVVASNVPGCKELVVEGKNGFLVQVRDASALANAMKQFILKPELIQSMGLQARQHMQTYYDAKQVSKNILNFMGLYS